MMHKDVRWNCSFSLVTLSWHPEHGILSFGQAFTVISSHAAMCWCPSLGHLSYFWAIFEVIVGIAIVALPLAGWLLHLTGKSWVALSIATFILSSSFRNVARHWGHNGVAVDSAQVSMQFL